MKQYRLTFTEEQWTQFENLIGELPTKFGVPLLNMINPNLQVAEADEPVKPIGGGGGSLVAPNTAV